MGVVNIFPIINLDQWKENLMIQASGTRMKRWIINPDTGEQVLVKWPNYGTGEVYAEKICSEIGKLINIQVMKVDLGCCWELPVVVAYNFVEPGEDLKEGGDFFETFQNDSGKPSLAPGYTYQRIKDIVSHYELIPQLLDMLVFDCLVANSDRHQDNWGICFRGNKVRFAPLYDHGSSLGWNLQEKRVEDLLLSTRSFEGFINRGKTLIGWNTAGKVNHFVLIANILNQNPEMVTRAIQKVHNISEDSLRQILEWMPISIMSEKRREFVIQLILKRKLRLERMVD